MPQSASTVPLSELFVVFLKIGLLSFGGPAAQIALMHRMLVDEKAWLQERQFLNALNFCMLLPGPEAMQLATYSGWRLHGILGGILAGLLFVLPGAVVIFILAALYVTYGDLPLIATLFLGVKAAVLIIVLEALLRVSSRALKGKAHWVIAALAFVGIFFLALPYPLIVLAAALYGAVFAVDQDKPQTTPIVATSFKRTCVTLAVGLAIWLLPLLALNVATEGGILGSLGLFFSKLAVVTFGGAYAVLAYMAQVVVTDFNWLTPAEMMDGLGLAETTPGPLILVTQFVGFIAAFREGSYGLAILGGLVTLWATFIPCFLWIFTGAPYIEWMSAQPRLSGALQAITAAVVGVILNLSIWFGIHVLFAHVSQNTLGPLTVWTPDLASLDWRTVALAVLSAVLILRAKLGIAQVLALSAAAAWALSFVG